MVTNKQLQLTVVTAKTGQELAEAKASGDTEGDPDEGQRQAINKTRPQLVGIEVFDLLDAGEREVSAQAEE